VSETGVSSAGLCNSCVHAHPIHSSKGSTFIRCDLSFTDSRFPRYPTLPVLRCDGYKEVGALRRPWTAATIEDE